MLGRRAGSTVSVYAQVQCREPKTGQQKVQFNVKTKYIDDLGKDSLSMMSANVAHRYKVQHSQGESLHIQLLTEKSRFEIG